MELAEDINTLNGIAKPEEDIHKSFLCTLDNPMERLTKAHTHTHTFALTLRYPVKQFPFKEILRKHRGLTIKVINIGYTQ